MTRTAWGWLPGTSNIVIPEIQEVDVQSLARSRTGTTSMKSWNDTHVWILIWLEDVRSHQGQLRSYNDTYDSIIGIARFCRAGRA